MTLRFDREDSRSVLALALGGWGAAVAYAAAFDVFTRISPGAAAALAVLAALAPPAALVLDANLREQARRTSTAILGAVFMAALLTMVAGTGMLLRTHGFALEAAVTGPHALLTYFVGPVGLGLATALLQRVGGVRRSEPATSPAATPGVRRASHTSDRGAGAARA